MFLGTPKRQFGYGFQKRLKGLFDFCWTDILTLLSSSASVQSGVFVPQERSIADRSGRAG